MKKHTPTYSGFTLVELIISITIFGIIMVSVVSIFLFSSQMSARVEMNRAMQESIKSVLEDIAEGVRIQGLSQDKIENCSSSKIGEKIEKTLGLCLASGEKYMVGSDDGDSWQAVTDIDTCSAITGGKPKTCRILKRDSATDDYYPMTNSFLNFTNVEFRVIPGEIPRVIIHFTIQPAYRKGLSADLVEANTREIQTTISERIISTK